MSSPVWRRSFLEPDPLIPSFSPSGGEGARRAVEGDSERPSNRSLAWESGAEDARTPNAGAWSADSAASAKRLGVRPIYRLIHRFVGAVVCTAPASASRSCAESRGAAALLAHICG